MGRVTATVLFTDLVGSTELWGRLGEEAADELRRKHDQLLTQAVEANNGSVVKGLGDGIMATFAGASDAVAAAVAIQQAIDRLNRSGKVPVPLEVRLGLSAGDVSFEDDDVHGTPVIEASRLCGAAAGGEILASEIVRWLGGAQGALSLTPVGSLELKGLGVPVPAVRVEWEPAPVAAVPMPALLTDIGRIFVGRDAEVERLTQLWKDASAGERQVALLAGEPGVGKTRLAAEMALRVHDEGGLVLAGRCDEDLGVPYQPFVEAFRHYADHTSATDLGQRLGRYGGELPRLVPELAERVPDLDPPLQSDPETERYRLFDAVAAWLSAASAEQPLLLVVDDVQWAAKPTLLLLRHIIRTPGVRHVLILVTYRDSELTHDHPLVELGADLRREGGVERFALSGLDDVAVTALVEQAAGQTLDEEGVGLARAIYQETEGNPFFVREVLRHLAETKVIERHGSWRTDGPIERLGIPEGVRDVVGRRLSRLSREANETLRLAAVVGAEFEATVLRAAGEVDERTLLAGLDEAIEARLVREVSAARFRFSHALIRATLYESLTGVRRAALHRHVAEAIEVSQEGQLEEHLPALAHHWAKANVPAESGRAVGYARRAGDQALKQLAHDEAAGYYRQALEFRDGVADPDGSLRLELLISLGEAQRRAGDTAHRETLLEASRLAGQRGDAEALARATLANTRGIYSSVVGEIDAERVAALESALAAVGTDDSNPTRARLLATLGKELVFAGDRTRRVRLADEALAVARRSGDETTLVQVLLQRFYTIHSPDTLEQRLALSEELVPLAEALSDPLITARAMLERFRALAESGAMNEADRHLEAVERLAQELGQPTLQWLVGLNRTGRTILAGHLDDGERQAQAGFALGQATGQPDAATFLTGHLFLVRFEQGRLAELEDRLLEKASALPGLPLLQGYLALLFCELDRPDEARAHYEFLAADDFGRLPFDSAWVLGMLPSAAVCAYLGDEARARVLFDLLVPYAGQIVYTAGGSLGAVTHYLALLATTLGAFDKAEQCFLEAASTHERIGASAWLARTRLEWARMLLGRREPDDDRARELLGQALDTAQNLGLANIERRAVALLQDCP